MNFKFQNTLHTHKMGGSNVFERQCENVPNALSPSHTAPIVATRLDSESACFNDLGTLVLIAKHLACDEHTRGKQVQSGFDLVKFVLSVRLQNEISTQPSVGLPTQTYQNNGRELLFL